MDKLQSKYDIEKRDLARGRNLKMAAVATPLALTFIPAVIFILLTFIFGSTPPVAAMFFFVGLIVTALGFMTGISLAAFFAVRHANWTKEMRERIASDGIRAEEIEWFRGELKTSEKNALRQVQKTDLLLADAYRETLASRLTATRIIKASKRELQMTQKRQNRIKYLKAANSEKFLSEVKRDAEKIRSINDEAKQMLAEAESRLYMIEAAAVRGSDLADSELALKKLSARSKELPLALEEARMTEEIRREIENETAVDVES
ncbi:MAG: hypothetical protein ABI539_15645 [Acidobacteriota bacterium]